MVAYLVKRITRLLGQNGAPQSGNTDGRHYLPILTSSGIVRHQNGAFWEVIVRHQNGAFWEVMVRHQNGAFWEVMVRHQNGVF